MESGKDKYMPLLPYDCSPRENFIIYDNVSYVQNRDLCKEKIMMSTGNVIKYYTCKPSHDVINIATEPHHSESKIA